MKRKIYVSVYLFKADPNGSKCSAGSTVSTALRLHRLEPQTVMTVGEFPTVLTVNSSNSLFFLLGTSCLVRKAFGKLRFPESSPNFAAPRDHCRLST